jgi:glycosyltransferase involved in cell wall biosynthesis
VINQKNFDDIKIEKKYFGIVNYDKIIKNIYYSSDIFVLPSLFESFGKVFTEASCFGLPSVAFKNTAVSEIIKHKQNGYLADFKSSKDLANGIKWANNELKISSNFKKNNRNMIIKNFSYKNRINDYLKFYKKILEK